MANQGINTIYAKERYGSMPDGAQPPSADRAIRYGKALKMILAGDGEVSAKEQKAFLEHGEMMGIPADVIATVNAFDPRREKLEDQLRGLSDCVPARRMLYDAIRIAMTDGYADRERAMTRKAAELLGIDKDVLEAIEGIVSVEDALRTARGKLLTPGYNS
jgi:tellurite resistance protein